MDVKARLLICYDKYGMVFDYILGFRSKLSDYCVTSFETQEVPSSDAMKKISTKYICFNFKVKHCNQLQNSA